MSKQPARFCLDETSFELNDELLPTAERLFEDLLAFVEKHVKSQNQEVTCWSKIYDLKIYSGLSLGKPDIFLCDLLYANWSEEEPEEGLSEEKFSLDHDLKELLRLFIEKCPNWDETLPPEEAQRISELPVQIGEQQEQLAPSLAFVHEQVTKKYAISCLRLVNKPEEVGPQPVSIEGKEQTLYFVSTEPQLRAFYREIPEFEDLNEERYIEHSALAFPALYFVPNIDKQLRRFSKTFTEIRSQVTQHLSALNDHFRAAFDSHKGEVKLIQAEMKSRCGVEMSPESGNTKGNKAAWEERKVTVTGKDLYCEWHTKFSWDTNRIHFHPGTPGIADGKIVIGIFAAHLST